MKLQNNQWIGALYYQLVTIKEKRNYYVLFGWDGNNDRSNKKIAEY